MVVLWSRRERRQAAKTIVDVGGVAQIPLNPAPPPGKPRAESAPRPRLQSGQQTANPGATGAQPKWQSGRPAVESLPNASNQYRRLSFYRTIMVPAQQPRHAHGCCPSDIL